MANSLDPGEMTFGDAVIRYRATGEPFPAHLLIGMEPVRGTEKPKKDTLATKFNWGKPFYRKGGNGHDGNGNPLHGRAPGQILRTHLDNLTKADINTEGGN